jgi:hypothetical protein
MAWECDCRQNEMFAVCHHCGKPLCRTHGAVITDDDFSPGDPPSVRSAVHCQGCWDKYHPRAQEVERQEAGLTRAAAR